MTAPTGPPHDPRVGRQSALLLFLRVALGAVAVLGVFDLLVGESWKDRAAAVMVWAFVAVPAIRVVWLTVRWAGKRDWRFAAAGVALLVVMASGALLA